jgi:hypothetical protein
MVAAPEHRTANTNMHSVDLIINESGSEAWSAERESSFMMADESTGPVYWPLSVGLDGNHPGAGAEMVYGRAVPPPDETDRVAAPEHRTTKFDESTWSFVMTSSSQAILKQAATSGANTTLKSPTSTMTKPATEPSCRPNSWAFAVPAPCAPMPRSAPRASGE